jgi:hypothetical protein
MTYVVIVYCYTIYLPAKTINPVRAWHGTMADSTLPRDDKLTQAERSLDSGSQAWAAWLLKYYLKPTAPALTNKADFEN